MRALFALRPRWSLISLCTFVSFRSLGPAWSGWTMLTWGTRPATSPSNTLRAMYRAGQATQGQLDFPFDAITIIMTDSYTEVVLYIFEVAFLATVNSCNYKERKEKTVKLILC